MSAEKKNTMKGFWSLMGSMLLYAFSGVVVVGLSAAFGNVGQVTFRALAALVLTIFWLVISGFRYKLRYSDSYDKKWLVVDIICRPIYNICFVYAALSIGPTAALFYLFASKVIFGGLIKMIFGSKKKLFWADYLSYVVVLVGLFVFTYPINAFMSFGVIVGLISGLFEAIKSRAMNELNVKSEDRPVVALYEFLSLAVVTAIVVLLVGQSFVIAPMTVTIWMVLGASGIVAVGSLFFELMGFAEFDDDLGNAVLASEMGFAGVINYLILGTNMSPTQIVGAVLLIVSLAFVAVAAYKRKKRDGQKGK